MKALSPARVKEVRIHEDTGTAEVIVPDYQLSLAIGKEGQNARLAARLTGWRVDIKSETQLAEEAAYQTDDWAQGEWIIDPESGEQMWQPADGSPAMTADEWSQLGAEQAAEAAEGEPDADGEVAEAPAADGPAEAAEQGAEGAEEPAEAAGPAGGAAHLHRVPPDRLAGGTGAPDPPGRRIAGGGTYTSRPGCVAVPRLSDVLRRRPAAWGLRPGPASAGCGRRRRGGT
jgi:hypothetical protein